jgi:hypothetical protein
MIGDNRGEIRRSDSREGSDHQSGALKSRDIVKSLWDDVKGGKIQREKITDEMKVKMLTYKLDMLDLRNNIQQSLEIKDYEGQKKYEEKLASKEEEFKGRLKEWGIEWIDSTNDDRREYGETSEVSPLEQLQERLKRLVEDCCPSQEDCLLRPQIDIELQLGNYRLGKCLGGGGFGNVFLGEHIKLCSDSEGVSSRTNTQTDASHLTTTSTGIESIHSSEKLVAVKVLHHEGQIEREHVEKFCREIEYMARLNHPNIVRLLDFGSLDKVPFLVMEHAPHGTLFDALCKGKRFSLTQVAKLVNQVADALQYMHNQGMMHRDIKPQNLVLRTEDEVLVVDLGSAAPVGTPGGENDGTFGYQAPEQRVGKACPASDQYALAIVAFQLLTGMGLGISSKIGEVLSRARNRDPNKRYPDVKAFAEAFKQACQEQAQDHQALEQVAHQEQAHQQLSQRQPQRRLLQRLRRYVRSCWRACQNDAKLARSAGRRGG